MEPQFGFSILRINIDVVNSNSFFRTQKRYADGEDMRIRRLIF